MSYEEIKEAFDKYLKLSLTRLREIRKLQDSPNKETRYKFFKLYLRENAHYKSILRKQLEYERGIIGDEEAIEFLNKL